MARLPAWVGRHVAQSSSAQVLVAASTIALLNFIIVYPGAFSPDALSQYSQAVGGAYFDWHPPAMARLWSMLLPIHDGTAPMLAVQLAMHWLGFGLIADALRRSGWPRAWPIALIAGCWPTFLVYGSLVMKDVSLADAFIAGFAIIFWFRAQGRRVPVLAVICAVVLLAYGSLVRANGVFALPPLLLYALLDLRKVRMPTLAALSVAGAVVALPLSFFANHQLLKAERTGVEQSLQLFDLSGIAYHSGDFTVLPKGSPLTSANIETCYTPLLWDTLKYPPCREAWSHLETADGTRRPITRVWLQAMLTHPLAYAEHRVRHFNHSAHFLVPFVEQCRIAPTIFNCGGTRVEADGTVHIPLRFFIVDGFRKNGLVWPATWLVLGLTLLVFPKPRGPQGEASRILLMSGLIYGFAYVVVGVATDPRYFYWTTMAVLVSGILTWNAQGHPRRTNLALVALPVIMVLLVGYGFRLVDWVTY